MATNEIRLVTNIRSAPAALRIATRVAICIRLFAPISMRTGRCGRNACRLGVDMHGIVGTAPISAGNRQGYRETDVAARLDDQGIPSCQSRERQAQTPERIPFVRVRTREVHDELRLGVSKHLREYSSESVEV